MTRPLVYAALAALALVHIAGNAAWFSGDDGVQFTDGAFHYAQTLELREATLGGTEALVRLPDQNEHQRYGVLFYAIATLISFLTGPEPNALLLGLSFVYWPLLLGGAYLLGRELGPPERGPATGLACATVAGFIPGLFNYTRTIVLDLPLVLAVLWGVVLLLRELRLEEPRALRRNRVAFGLVLAVGLAIKLNALAFLAGPALVLWWPALRGRWTKDRAEVLRGGALALATVFAVTAALLLGPRSEAILDTLRLATWPGALLEYAEEGALSDYPAHYARGVWGLSWEICYFTLLQSLSPPIALLGFGSCLWVFGRRRGCEDPLARRQRALLFAWFALPSAALLFGLRGLYDERYILPILPWVAALVAVTWAELPRPRLRWVVGALGTAFLCLNYLTISFDAWPTARPRLCAEAPGWTATDRVGKNLYLCALYADYQFMDRPSTPLREDWGLDALEDALGPDRRALKRPLKAVFLDDLYSLFYRAFDRDLRRDPLFRHQDALLLGRCWDEGWLRAMFGSLADAEANIAAADLVLMRYGSPSGLEDQRVRGKRCLLFWSQANRWVEGRSLPLADGTELRLYHRKVENAATGTNQGPAP